MRNKLNRRRNSIEFVVGGLYKGRLDTGVPIALKIPLKNVNDANNAIDGLSYIQKTKIIMRDDRIIDPMFPYLLFDLRHREVTEQIDRYWAVSGMLCGNRQLVRQRLLEAVDYSPKGRLQC